MVSYLCATITLETQFTSLANVGRIWYCLQVPSFAFNAYYVVTKPFVYSSSNFSMSNLIMGGSYPRHLLSAIDILLQGSSCRSAI